MPKMTSQTMGIFDSVRAAEQARTALLDAGIDEDRIALSADLSDDAIAGEAPGQSYENQPGQSPEDSAAARYSEAVRGGVCVLTVSAESHIDRKYIEQLLRQKGARRTAERRDVQPPYRSYRQSAPRTPRAEAGAEGAQATPSASSARRPVSEWDRIDFLVRRDGEEQARAWVERTLKLYREAIASRSPAATDAYRPMFEESIRVYEQWLRRGRAVT
jgi:hypothetical protein